MIWRRTKPPALDPIPTDSFACIVCGGTHPFEHRQTMIGMQIINHRLRYPCPVIERIESVVIP